MVRGDIETVQPSIGKQPQKDGSQSRYRSVIIPQARSLRVVFRLVCSAGSPLWTSTGEAAGVVGSSPREVRPLPARFRMAFILRLMMLLRSSWMLISFSTREASTSKLFIRTNCRYCNQHPGQNRGGHPAGGCRRDGSMDDGSHPRCGSCHRPSPVGSLAGTELTSVEVMVRVSVTASHCSVVTVATPGEGVSVSLAFGGMLPQSVSRSDWRTDHSRRPRRNGNLDGIGRCTEGWTTQRKDSQMGWATATHSSRGEEGDGHGDKDAMPRSEPRDLRSDRAAGATVIAPAPELDLGKERYSSSFLVSLTLPPRLGTRELRCGIGQPSLLEACAPKRPSCPPARRHALSSYHVWHQGAGPVGLVLS